MCVNIPLHYLPVRCHGLVLYVLSVLLIFLLIFLDVTDYKYGQHSHSFMGTGDVAVAGIADDFNRILCSAYDITSDSRTDVFPVDGEARIDYTNRTFETRQVEELLPAAFGVRNAFYLLEGSVITVKACMYKTNIRKDINVILFKGGDSWNEWMSGSCRSCQTARSPVESMCSNVSETVMKYHVTERDVYYITVTQADDHNLQSLDVYTLLEVNRTTFDTSQAAASCINVTNCLIQLPYAHSSDVVLKFADKDAISFRTKCQLRVISWAGLFVILPIPVILFGVGIYFRFCRKVKKSDTPGSLNNEKSNLIPSSFPDEYRTDYSEKV